MISSNKISINPLWLKTYWCNSEITISQRSHKWLQGLAWWWKKTKNLPQTSKLTKLKLMINWMKWSSIRTKNPIKWSSKLQKDGLIAWEKVRSVLNWKNARWCQIWKEVGIIKYYGSYIDSLINNDNHNT